jgi:DNA invertase Pin-like site-specific DNA recombinase
LKTSANVVGAEHHFYEGRSEMESCLETPGPQTPLVRAIAYYRHSANERQEASLAIQRNHVRRWASENGVEIIREFCDTSPSSIDSADRLAFTEMLEDWIKHRSDFEYVLCLDASRWDRFPNSDLAARFSEACAENKKQLIYTAAGKLTENEAFKEVWA